MTRRLVLRWWPSPLALALGTTSALALVLAVADRRPELIAFTAPLIGALAGGWGCGRPATHVEVRAGQATERCFEQDSLPIGLRAAAVGGAARFTLRPLLPADLTELPGAAMRARRWGRYTVGVRVTARAAGGLLIATVVTDAFDVRVYPRPASLGTGIRPGELLDRLGVHTGRMRGGGVEFAGIRPYVPGDPVVNLNWLATSRLGRPQVTERLAARAADVVAVIDTLTPSGLDAAVHGATALAQAALRRGDRAGVLALGGAPRWLAPDMGRRQFYRVVDTVLDIGPTAPGAAQAPLRVPRTGLPPRSWVIVFSPLLDARIGPVIADLRARGHAVLVVDVLRRPQRPPDSLIGQVWRFDREVLRRDLAAARVPVLAWADGSSLDEALGASPFSVPHRRNRESAPGPR
jgi:uncharacterized protein (DUF58 family)